MPVIMPYKSVYPQIGERVFIAPTSVVIGDTHIGDFSSIWFNATIRGDVHQIRIGARTSVQDNAVIHATYQQRGTYIGDDVTIGHSAVLHACTLEDNSFIGMGAVLLDGVVVESEAMVAAGALVSPGKKIPSGELWAGNPARCMRLLTVEERAGFKDHAAHYVRLAASYLPSEK